MANQPDPYPYPDPDPDPDPFYPDPDPDPYPYPYPYPDPDPDPYPYPYPFYEDHPFPFLPEDREKFSRPHTEKFFRPQSTQAEEELDEWGNLPGITEQRAKDGMCICNDCCIATCPNPIQEGGAAETLMCKTCWEYYKARKAGRQDWHCHNFLGAGKRLSPRKAPKPPESA